MLPRRGGNHHVLGHIEFSPPLRPGRHPGRQHGRRGRKSVGDHVFLSVLHVSSRSLQFQAVTNVGRNAVRAGDRDRFRLHRHRVAFHCHPEVRRCGKDVLSQHPDRIRFSPGLAPCIRTVHQPVRVSREHPDRRNGGSRTADRGGNSKEGTTRFPSRRFHRHSSREEQPLHGGSRGGARRSCADGSDHRAT